VPEIDKKSQNIIVVKMNQAREHKAWFFDKRSSKALTRKGMNDLGK